MMRIFASVFALLLSVNIAQAQLEFPGSDDPLLRTATSAWLDGEDEGAVRLLFSLASDGNTAAQVLLGTLAGEPWRFSDVPWLNTPEVRRVVLAAANDANPLFGIPWLEVARDSLPVPEMYDAIVLVGRTRNFEDALATLPAILDAGEHRLALDLIRTSATSGRTEHLFDVVGTDAFPASAGWIAYDALATELLLNGAVSSVVGISNAVDLVESYGTIVEGNSHILWAQLRPSSDLRSATRGTLEAQVWALPELDPVRRFCSDVCSDTAPQCVVSMMALAPAGSLLRATLSPVEALVDTDRYQSSPRFAEDLIALARQGWRNFLPASEQDALERYEACVPGLIARTP